MHPDVMLLLADRVVPVARRSGMRRRPLVLDELLERQDDRGLRRRFERTFDMRTLGALRFELRVDGRRAEDPCLRTIGEVNYFPATPFAVRVASDRHVYSVGGTSRACLAMDGITVREA